MSCPPSPLITDTQLAARLGVRTAWLRAEAELGRLPFVQAGDRLLFDPVLVERLLLERARKIPPYVCDKAPIAPPAEENSSKGEPA